MGSSAKKKKEKKLDFQKTKLKVGKARPKNTNATDTSFAAKSIVLKQQSLSEVNRDSSAIFIHNVSLLSSKAEGQRKDALSYLTNSISSYKEALPQSASVILAKAQPLILDANSNVRQQLLKLFRALPSRELGSLDQTLLYTRAGLSHLSTEIRLSALDVLDWLVASHGETIVSSAGGWIRTLRTFQNLLSWTCTPGNLALTSEGKWSATKASSSMGNSKLRVHQLNTLAAFLTAGLSRTLPTHDVAALQAMQLFPLSCTEVHLLPTKSNPFGYLNLFGTPRDIESEMYDSVDDRREIFIESGLQDIFAYGVSEAKREGGELGRAAAAVAKALRLAEG